MRLSHNVGPGWSIFHLSLVDCLRELELPGRRDERRGCSNFERFRPLSLCRDDLADSDEAAAAAAAAVVVAALAAVAEAGPAPLGLNVDEIVCPLAVPACPT